MDPTTESRPAEPAIKHGQELLQRVEQRKQELAARLTQIQSLAPEQRDHSGRTGIEEALTAAAGLLTGDLSHIAEPTATQLNQWLETSRYLCDDQQTVDAKSADASALAALSDPPKIEA